MELQKRLIQCYADFSPLVICQQKFCPRSCADLWYLGTPSLRKQASKSLPLSLGRVWEEEHRRWYV